MTDETFHDLCQIFSFPFFPWEITKTAKKTEKMEKPRRHNNDVTTMMTKVFLDLPQVRYHFSCPEHGMAF
jgi:hypothetical protein